MTMSRVVTGMHTIDQVLQGSLLGIWTALMAILLLKPIYLRYLNKLREKPE
jgi:membrane-associated phospholipid phosphatase